MTISLNDILDKRVIDVAIDARNKVEAIDYLSKLLFDAGYITDIDSYKEDIYLRESQGQTGIGNYIAIPHGQSESVVKNGIAIGKLKHEIDWETLDGNGVKVVCLFSVSNNPESGRDHLMMLAQLAGKLGNDDNVALLLEAETKDDIISVFT
ncbi:PTS sugar transporter subunit IIA [Erysipelothrix sp. HDW6C]|uniref:PTS sugar transporter subunit IIA n=1 Tax=Erysipelothrix sp. HDW6C TaxID=2714930 RepID=UPI001F0F2F07|nr:PTS sugar transporter subunit IIA [Erysipelothrix sp. HDW6C]